MTLSLASLSSTDQLTPTSTTSRPQDLHTCTVSPDTVSIHSRGLACRSRRPPSSDVDSTSVNTASRQSDMNKSTKSLQLDLSSLSHAPTYTSSHVTLTGPPTTRLALLSAGARQSCQHAVQLVIQATDDLCHVIQQHLSQHDVISSASTSSASASTSRRMLPIVPGTSTVPGAALLAGPGSSLAATANMMRCHSARTADRTRLSRHISTMCCPLKQRSNDV